MNLRTAGAWTTAGAAFWVTMASFDVTADGARVIRLAMLPGLASLAACLGLALLTGAVLGMRLTDAARGPPGRARRGLATRSSRSMRWRC